MANTPLASKTRVRRTTPVPLVHVAAVKRVLRLVDGYASTDEDRLMAYKGGVMTWKDLRRHIQAAIKLLPSTKR